MKSHSFLLLQIVGVHLHILQIAIPGEKELKRTGKIDFEMRCQATTDNKN